MSWVVIAEWEGVELQSYCSAKNRTGFSEFIACDLCHLVVKLPPRLHTKCEGSI